MVIGQGMGLAGVGVVIGLGSALGLTRFLASFLYGVSPRDWIVFTTVPIVLGLVAFVAVWLPAVRATHVDPMTVLRSE
jgi:ABC-type antimicrobial peptide transport system permease subunit